MGWVDLIVDVARKAERELGGLGPFTPEEAGAFAANAFIGAESLYLLGIEKKGVARAPGAAARRRSHSHCGSWFIEEVMSCVPSCPSKEGFVERDGVKIHYEVYGDGPETMVFLPPWSIVHSRVYKAQLPYFSERFRCITFDAARQRQIRTGRRSRRLHAGQLRRRRPRRHGCHGCRQGDPGRPLLRRHARLRAGRTSSRAREGGDPGRHRGEHRPRLPLSDAEAFPGQARAVRGLGQVQPRILAGATIPTSPSTSCATSSPSRTRPSRSRTASNGRTRPRGRCWPRPWRRGRSRRHSMSARRCTARSAAPC